MEKVKESETKQQDPLHDFDRPIEMAANPLPRYYTVIFAGLVLWATVFAGWYLFSGWSSQGEFADKMKAHTEQTAMRPTAGAAAPAAADPEKLRAIGSNLYAENCAACHGATGTGGIGPDLTAAAYQYGKDNATVRASIAAGRPAGMPAFGNQLSPEQIDALTLYVTGL